jgi:hypothetical protein
MSADVLEFPAEKDSEIVTRALHRLGITDFLLIVDGREHVITDLDGKDILWHLRTTEFKLMRIADGLVCTDDSTPA